MRSPYWLAVGLLLLTSGCTPLPQKISRTPIPVAQAVASTSSATSRKTDPRLRFNPILENESFDQLGNDSITGNVPILGDFLIVAREDLRNFYSSRNLPYAAGAIGIAAIMANSDIDQDVLEHVQGNITFVGSDEYQNAVSEFKFFGEGYFLLPAYAGTAILGKHFLGEHEFAYQAGEWGERSFRGILIGTPPLLISQYVLGASRPGETDEGSEWQLMGDDNAVSGHAFMGAIPFLTAAHMSDRVGYKTLFIVLSTLPALSRVTENGHYPSQAFLGWALAYAATKSVDRTANTPEHVELYPVINNNGFGAGVSIKH